MFAAAALKQDDFLSTFRKALIQLGPKAHTIHQRGQSITTGFIGLELNKKKKYTLPYNLYLYHLDHLENKLEVSPQCYRTNGNMILTSH